MSLFACGECIVLGTFSTSGEEIICIACLWTCGKSMY